MPNAAPSNPLGTNVVSAQKVYLWAKGSAPLLDSNGLSGESTRCGHLEPLKKRSLAGHPWICCFMRVCHSVWVTVQLCRASETGTSTTPALSPTSRRSLAMVSKTR